MAPGWPCAPVMRGRGAYRLPEQCGRTLRFFQVEELQRAARGSRNDFLRAASSQAMRGLA